jgi:hypothetical protein
MHVATQVSRPPDCDGVPATQYQVHVYDFIDDTHVNAVPIVSEKKVWSCQLLVVII